MNGLDGLLGNLQSVNYQNAEYWRLVKSQVRTPVNKTPRIKRLRAMVWCLVVVGLGLPALCLAQTIALANRLCAPWEKWRNRRYVQSATKKLRQRPDLIKIGITGSYGKTTVKNILCAMLSVKYRVVVSPASFNTPLGLARTVHEQLRPDTQVLIMEMGARHAGDIREMCDLVQPHHGIITSIGPCHLATFGNVETVARTKGELFACLPPNGWAVTDGDNPWCRTLHHPHLCLVTKANRPVYDTALLGEHNQTNIALASALAQHLGITPEQIKRVASALAPTPHRLQKIIAPNGIIILDDSYNANPHSAHSALKVLASMPGRKVVQTPGFVEQGANTVTAHRELCAQIKTIADAVIVVGELNCADFQVGLAGWTKPVYFVPNRDDAKTLYAQLLRAGDTLLILNDIPEKYV